MRRIIIVARIMHTTIIIIQVWVYNEVLYHHCASALLMLTDSQPHVIAIIADYYVLQLLIY